MNKFSTRNIILLSILGLQIFALILVNIFDNKPLSPLSAHKEYLLPGWELNQIDQFSITDETGRTVVLQKIDDVWVIPALNNYPVSLQKQQLLISSLLGINSNYLVTTSPDHQIDMEVGPQKFRRRIQIVSDKKEQTIFIGNSKNSSFCHVRLDGSDKIWGIEGLTEWQYPAREIEWAQKVYFQTEASKIGYLAIDGSSMQMSLQRNGEEAWHWPNHMALDAFPPDQEKINSLIDELTMLEIAAIGPAVDSQEGRAQLQNKSTQTIITLRGEDGYQLYFWPTDKDQHLCYLVGATHLVYIDNWSISSLLDFLS